MIHNEEEGEHYQILKNAILYRAPVTDDEVPGVLLGAAIGVSLIFGFIVLFCLLFPYPHS